MNPHKKNIELTGSLKISAQEICFETVNTNYHLHVKQEVSA